MRISLITLSRDNPSEVLKTLRSVQLQTSAPDFSVVVDSSGEPAASTIRAMAEHFGAKYVWIEPKGIYPAMVHSVSLVPHESYAWWINSSDWLAGRRSIQQAREALALEAPKRPDWLVGQLIRLRGRKVAYHASGTEGKRFLQLMQSGRIGFPHPATLFWVPSLVRVRPFDDGFSIASDYATALRFGDKFGPPVMSSMPLSVHVPNGLSAKQPAKNLLERSQARRALGSPSRAELWRVFVSAVIGIANLVSGSAGGNESLPGQEYPLGGNLHFCNSPTSLPWPDCCDAVLEEPFDINATIQPREM